LASMKARNSCSDIGYLGLIRIVMTWYEVDPVEPDPFQAVKLHSL